jgi:lipoprotein-releasing system ATP-binding protein
MNDTDHIADPTVVLQATGLRHVFNDAGDRPLCVLNALDLSVKEGELLAIIGASGSGKSTLLHILGGLDQPTEGEVVCFGESILTASERRKAQMRNRYLGFVYQFHHLLPEFNALENVSMPLLIRGMPIKKAQAEAASMLEHVGLAERMSHRIHALSGGERQRVAVARALVTRPACVLADEPTGNLDELSAQHVVDVMTDLNARLGTAFVLVTHDHQVASRMNRIVQLKAGRLHPVTQPLSS